MNTSLIDKKLPTSLLERLSGIQLERTSGLLSGFSPNFFEPNASAPSGSGSSISCLKEAYPLLKKGMLIF
jgi:hypothetical protein